MKGLIEKDLRLLSKRKQTIILFFGITILMSFTSGAFAVAYTTFLLTLMVISTINYDEFDNGYAFLMTLPITREKYVRSKYVLALSSDVIAWVVSVVVLALIYMLRGENVNLLNNVFELLLYVPFALVCADIMIPVQLKYGAEKSRIAMAIICIIFGSFGVIAMKVLKSLDTDGSVTNMLNGIDDAIFLSIAVLFCLMLTVISYMISVKIMNNKEF